MIIIKTFESFNDYKPKLRYIGPNPTSDTIVTRIVDGIQQVLLVQRSASASAEPNKWSIPGGFVDTNANRGSQWEPGRETELEAAKREVKEETGLDLSNITKDSDFKFVGIYDSIDRDPRNIEGNRDTKGAWIKANVFTVEIPHEYGDDVKGMDDAQDAQWFTIERLNDMNPNEFGFDHIDRLIQLGFIED